MDTDLLGTKRVKNVSTQMTNKDMTKVIKSLHKLDMVHKGLTKISHIVDLP